MTDAETQLEATDRVDLRAARSDSSEGTGLAKARRERFIGRYEPSDRVRVGPGSRPRGVDPSMVDEVRDAHADEMVAATADIGFWIAWHQAGGFEALERLGWHRTTIFRKLKRFRSRFGEHPDTWDPGWINLDLERLWKAEVDFAIDLRDGSAHPDEWPGLGGVWSADAVDPDLDGTE
ncbi:MAG: hypothetical protein ACYCVN_01645 [Acidimicrobiales bacterium]